MTRIGISHKITSVLAATTIRGAEIGALGASSAALGLAGLLAGEGLLTRVRIPDVLGEAPAIDGTIWGDARVGEHRPPIRLAVLGDSLAASLGAGGPERTVGGRLATSLSTTADRPVRLTSVAAVGARARDLRGQVDALIAGAVAAGRPDLAVMVIGANDVMHHCANAEALRQLALAVHRLALLGAKVIVATCPDVGAAPVLSAEPLRHLAARQARAYAAEQADVVRRVGGYAVDLIGPLGRRMRADHTMFAADGYHPSASGYAAAAEVLRPVAEALLGLAPEISAASPAA